MPLDWSPPIVGLEHPYQATSLGPKVTPRRCSLSTEHTKHKLHNLCTHPQCRFVEAATHCSQPDKLDIWGRIPLPEVWDTTHPLSRPLAFPTTPQTAKAKAPMDACKQKVIHFFKVATPLLDPNA